MSNNWRPHICPLTTILQVSFSTHCAFHDMGQNPKHLAEPTYIFQLACLSEGTKAELLTRNTITLSTTGREQRQRLRALLPNALGVGGEPPSDAKLKRWQKKPTPTKDTTATSHHQTPNFQLFKTCTSSWSAQNPGCRAVLRHRFNFCFSDLRNAVPACQKKVNERFSHPHNHVSVTFGSCELMPEIFGGYPL